MAKQGSIKHYRQSGATKAPADLPYSEIAVAKDGTVYAGNESNQPVEQAKASHTHDDRYYTETEMNTKLAGKANSSHTHTSIRMYNSDWSGTDGSITPVYANANKDYVNLSAGNDAGNKWPHVSCQRINGHVLNMSLSGTTLSITW